MTSLAPSKNLAARMGRWSASHWKTAVFGWLAFVVAALFLGNMIGTKNIDTKDVNTGESRSADHILQNAGFSQSEPLTEIMIVQSPSKTIADPAFRSAVRDVVGAVRPFRTAKDVRSPLDPAYHAQVSADKRTALVEWEMKGTQKVAEKNIDRIVAATGAVASGPSRLLHRRGRLRELEQGAEQDVLRTA